MNQTINEQVSVLTLFSHKHKKVVPRKVLWHGLVYNINKIGLHHTYKKGTILFHVFSVTSEDLFMRLILNTENLIWTLEEIANTHTN